MTKYVISDNRGNYIRFDGGSGKYVPIRSSAQAQKWDSYQKAKAIYQNCVSKAIREKYSVKEVTEDASVVVNEEPVLKEFNYDECKCDIDKLLGEIKALAETLDRVNSWEESLRNQVSIADRKRSDYDHYIETGKFNAVQCCKNTKLHKEILQERRKLKQAYFILRQIQGIKLDGESIKGLFSSIDSLETSVYQPRVLTELFS